MDEFSFIKDLLAKIADNKYSLNLEDDAAVINDCNKLVVSKDSIYEDVHFFKNDKPQDIVYKLFAVNLSDIAAMGATPFGYLLGLNFNKNNSMSYFNEFASQISFMIKKFGGNLLGGDTVTHGSSQCFSLTIMGTYENFLLKRSNAQINQSIYVSNKIGGSFLGLNYLKNPSKFNKIFDKKLINQYKNKYYYPDPQIKLGKILSKYDNCAAIDISDGLLGDLQHILNASKVSANINLESIPVYENNYFSKLDLINGGDDYELLFTIDSNYENDLLNDCEKELINISKIGVITESLDKNQNIISLYKNSDKINITSKSHIHNFNNLA